MIWCWQQDPEVRPTASQVVEVAKSEQFCRLIDGIRIDDNARVLCACKREIFVTMRQKNKKIKLLESTHRSLHLDASSSYQDLKESSGNFETTLETVSETQISPPSARSISEGEFEYKPATNENDDDDKLSSYRNDTLEQRKLDVVHKYELWISSSDVHSSRVTILDYCGRFTGIKVWRH